MYIPVGTYGYLHLAVKDFEIRLKIPTDGISVTYCKFSMNLGSTRTILSQLRTGREAGRSRVEACEVKTPSEFLGLKELCNVAVRERVPRYTHRPEVERDWRLRSSIDDLLYGKKREESFPLVFELVLK
jgi:hypothetical protein